MREISEWLHNVGLDRYSQLFADNAIDFEVLPHLSDKDLQDLGIPLGHRNKLLRAIKALCLVSATDVAPPSGTIGLSSAPAQFPGHSEAERRQLTTIFCDLIGSTELSRCLDPEDYREVIQAYNACCATVITRFDGFVAKYMGDGVLAYFGYPQA